MRSWWNFASSIHEIREALQERRPRTIRVFLLVLSRRWLMAKFHQKKLIVGVRRRGENSVNQSTNCLFAQSRTRVRSWTHIFTHRNVHPPALITTHTHTHTHTHTPSPTPIVLFKLPTYAPDTGLAHHEIACTKWSGAETRWTRCRAPSMAAWRCPPSTRPASSPWSTRAGAYSPLQEDTGESLNARNFCRTLTTSWEHRLWWAVDWSASFQGWNRNNGKEKG